MLLSGTSTSFSNMVISCLTKRSSPDYGGASSPTDFMIWHKKCPFFQSTNHKTCYIVGKPFLSSFINRATSGGARLLASLPLNLAVEFRRSSLNFHDSTWDESPLCWKRQLLAEQPSQNRPSSKTKSPYCYHIHSTHIQNNVKEIGNTKYNCLNLT